MQSVAIGQIGRACGDGVTRRILVIGTAADPRGALDGSRRTADSLATARFISWQGAGTVYLTDRRSAVATGTAGDAWESLPGHWDAFVSRIGTGVSE